MKKKIIGIFVTTLVITIAIYPVLGAANINQAIRIVPEKLQSVKDQFQEFSDECAWLSSGTAEWQEFINQGNKIMSVELYMYNSAPHEDGFVKLSIEKPLGTELTKKVISCKDIAPGYSDIWFSFDVDPDVNLVKGDKYYIVFYYDGPCELCWHGAYNNRYPNGGSSKGGDWDFCFRTFVDKSKAKTIDTPFPIILTSNPNHPPEKPTIDNPPTAKVNEEYRFTAHSFDQEYDQIYFKVNYFDGTITDWIGPFGYDAHAELAHIYTEEGFHQLAVKAIDDPNMDGDLSDGIVSEQANSVVEVTRSKEFRISISFFKFLEQYQIIYQLLQRLLKL